MVAQLKWIEEECYTFFIPKWKLSLNCISAGMDKREMLYFHHLKMKVIFDFYSFITR